jgi:hypothetical protein
MEKDRFVVRCGNRSDHCGSFWLVEGRSKRDLPERSQCASCGKSQKVKDLRKWGPFDSDQAREKRKELIVDERGSNLKTEF